jgi:membrane protease YdiL (CAAX protease family)
MFPWRPGWWVIPLGIGYSIAVRIGTFLVVMVAVTIVLVIQASTPQEVQHYINNNRPTVETLVSVSAMRSNPAYYWLTITLVSFVVAGFREEVWRAAILAAMRVLWPRPFGSRAGQCVAVLLIAVVFGASHLTMGPIAAVLAGVLGLFLGLILVLHQSIWPAVIAHGLFDATTMAVLPWWMERVQQLQ